jgi:hypothetical protein
VGEFVEISVELKFSVILCAAGRVPGPFCSFDRSLMERSDLGVTPKVSLAGSASDGWIFLPVDRTCVKSWMLVTSLQFVIRCPDCAGSLVDSEVRTVTGAI